MNKYKFTAIILFFGYLALGQTIVTDRPDQTESSSTIGKGELQIESGILYGIAKNDFFSDELLLAPTVLWRYGIKSGIELRLLTEFASVKDKMLNNRSNGITDLQLGTKIQILKKDEAKTEIAFLSHVIIPTAEDELTLGEVGTINKLSFAHDIGDTFVLGYNVGYDYYGFGSGNLTYSLSFGLGISDKVGMYIEPFGALVEMDTHEASFDTGFTYLIKDNFQFDFSFGTGINHTMNYLSVGCSLNIAKEKD